MTKRLSNFPYSDVFNDSPSPEGERVHAASKHVIEPAQSSNGPIDALKPASEKKELQEHLPSALIESPHDTARYTGQELGKEGPQNPKEDVAPESTQIKNPAEATTEGWPEGEDEVIQNHAESIDTQVEGKDSNMKGTWNAKDMVELRKKLWEQLLPESKTDINPSQEGSLLLQELDDLMDQLVEHPPKSYKDFRDAEFGTLLGSIRSEDRIAEDEKFHIKERARRMAEKWKNIRLHSENRQGVKRHRIFPTNQKEAHKLGCKTRAAIIDDGDTDVQSSKKLKQDNQARSSTVQLRRSPRNTSTRRQLLSNLYEEAQHLACRQEELARDAQTLLKSIGILRALEDKVTEKE